MQAGERQAQPGVLAAPAEWTLPKRPGFAANVWKFVRRKPLGAFGMLLVILMVAMTLGSPKAEFGMPELPNRPLGFELGKPWLARYEANDVFRGEFDPDDLIRRRGQDELKGDGLIDRSAKTDDVFVLDEDGRIGMKRSAGLDAQAGPDDDRLRQNADDLLTTNTSG